MFKSNRLFFALLVLLLSSETFASRFDSGHATVLNGTIRSGYLNSPTDNKTTIKGYIKQQLKFSVGQLNAQIAGVSIERELGIEIEDIRTRTDGRFDVSYRAKMLIAWPRSGALPQQHTLILPESGDHSRLQQFYQTYAKDCAQSQSSYAFFYYFRPQKANCPLKNPGSHPQAIKLRVDLVESDENTSNKSPEYDKVWEDNKLISVTVFGNTVSRDDFSKYYQALKTAYGDPVQQTTKDHGEIFKSQYATFNTPRGKLISYSYYIKKGNIASAPAELKQLINTQTMEADLISYNGHSGLGSNIAAFSRLVRSKRGQYQLVMLYGCDSFSYINNDLFEQKKSVNPGYAPTKYLDVITTLLPAYFGSSGPLNYKIAAAMVNMSGRYRELAVGSGAGYPIVLGEEDNP